MYFLKTFDVKSFFGETYLHRTVELDIKDVPKCPAENFKIPDFSFHYRCQLLYFASTSQAVFKEMFYGAG